MSWLASTAVRFGAQRVLPAFEARVRDPETAQRNFLAELLSGNAATSFGHEHGFSSIRGPAEYAERVPVRDYEGLRPWIDCLLAGEAGILTAEEPVMFATTSGTTSRPKMIPVTRAWVRELRALTCLWFYYSLRDHPGLLDRKAVGFVGPAVEGYTERGLPIGSISGLSYRKVPCVLRRNYAVPHSVSLITSYEDRYAIAARLILAADVSLMVAANPSTMLRLAAVATNRGERVIAAVRDGRLGVEPPDAAAGEEAAAQAGLYRKLESGLKPDPSRARALEACRAEAGRLRPKEAWPNLAMIGCWLGGSAGVQSSRIAKDYGEVPLRDVGLRATEATVTVPIGDGTPAGVLAPFGNFYEFVPEDEIETENPRTLLAHELEEGARYYLLLTTSSGLYRYDINDIVEVQGFYHRAPLLAFLRKGRDMANITGEKLHADQVTEAFHRATVETGLPAVRAQLIPEAQASRYDLLVELESAEPADLDAFAATFDRFLAEQNREYDQKRKSKRLHSPRAWRMKPGWSSRRQRADVEQRGKRDAQYKWPILELRWDDETRAEVAEPRAAEGGGPAASDRREIGPRAHRRGLSAGAGVEAGLP